MKRNSAQGTDDIRLNVKDGFELQYWARKFGVSKNDIRSAVSAVGDSLTSVQIHITCQPKAGQG